MSESEKLLVVYNETKQQLAKCTSLHETTEISGKAAALAYWGRMSKDETVYRHAKRMQDCAVRRTGKILLEQTAKGGPEIKGKSIDKNSTVVPGRTQLARSAGLSERQQKEAVNVARIPEKAFDKLVESDNPPTVTELAAMGARKYGLPDDYLKGRDPKDFHVGIAGRGGLRHFVEDTCQKLSPKVIGRGSIKTDVARVLQDIQKARKWLDELESEMGKVKS